MHHKHSKTHAASCFKKLCLAALLAGTCDISISSAADWPCFRGPDGLGVSAEKGLPLEWSKEKNVAWSIPLPGKGASAPVIVGNRVYVTTQTEDLGLHVLAIDRANGAVLWDQEIDRGKLPANNLHNMATPTPVANENNVWAMFGTGDLACLDKAGKVLWHRNLTKEYGVYKTNHGYGSSPMLEKGKLFVVCMHQGPSYVLAVDAKSGKNIWKTDRNLEPKDESQDSYSSPIFLRTGGRTQLVLEGAEAVTAYDSEKGDLLWSSGGLRVATPYGRTIAGLAAGEGVVLAVASGFQNRGYTVALNTKVKSDADKKLWTQAKFSPDCPTPVIYQGKVYMIRDDGNASCLDLKTGQPDWQERIFSSNVKVSPVAADGKVYFMSGQGNCTVVRAGPKFEVLAKNELNETTLTTPSISSGRIFLRTEKGLYCVGKGK
ncbi:MAG TPA: PQQ-binding-like beta-propeller repeat protein [Candidatus Saccharimonadales bacterium]|nr:PQQ-binding-like beta-propeller repeat protein [Candidatus Saccharimonadales bacterium]